MSGLLLAVWIVVLIFPAFGIISAGYNGDDGWSVAFIALTAAWIWAGVEWGWVG